MIQKKIVHSSWHSLGVSKYLRDFYISSFNDDFKCKPSSADGLRKPGWNFVHKKKSPNIVILLQKYQSYHMTQQFYTWASTQKKWTCVHTKTCITVQAGALFMAAPNRNVLRVHHLTRNELWFIQRGSCMQLTRPNSRLCPSTKKGLYTAEVCLFGPPKTRMKTGREMGWKRTPSQSLA